MKRYILLLLLAGLSFLGSCDNDNPNNNNRYLPNYTFQISVNIDLPLYNQLHFPSNPVLITTEGAGINGIIVMNTGNSFVAFEASCPNQPITSCSGLTVKGILAKCPCDDVEYSLFDGTTAAPVQYPLKRYRVQQTGPGMLIISN